MHAEREQIIKNNLLINNIPYPYAYYPSLSQSELDKIRAIIAEEVQKAMHPEQQGESAEVEYVLEGKRWRGTVYLVDEDEDKEC